VIDRHFEGSFTETRVHHGVLDGAREESAKGSRCTYIFCIIACTESPTVDWCNVAQVTTDMLPDVALLKIFEFYVYGEPIEAWHTLVHVCQKWRNVVFGSPRRLNLRLYYKAKTPVRETLDVWPPLPIIIRVYGHEMWDVDNIIAALEHNNRICELYLFDIPSWQFEKILAAMQQPFPELTHLELQPRDETGPVKPASFLGGSAPRLQTLILGCIPFPELPKLLLSATNLVDLNLLGIRQSGHISPEAMVTGLSVLTSLKRLFIKFESPRWRRERKGRRPPPPTRTLLPVLTDLRFRGPSKYLEDLVARIDAPLLDKLAITYFHQLIFDTPQLTQFIRRTPKFKALDEARVVFSDWHVWVTLPQSSDGLLELSISCRRSDWQLSSLAQVCSSSFPQAFIPAVEHLYILEVGYCDWQDDIEKSQWLELLRPFSAVKYLYLSRRFVQRIAPSLQELVGERVTEVLPSLQTLFLEETSFPSGSVQGIIGQFVAARQLGGHPITVSRWERKHFE
jgi:hypothetical protein